MLYEYYFEGRKPSLSQVKKVINEGLNKGYSMLELSWGENLLSIEKEGIDFYGWGWIKNISGGDLANELNQKGALK